MRAAAKYPTIRSMDDKSVGKLSELKARAAALEKAIEHLDTREHLLQPVGRWLRDAEGGGPHDHRTLLHLIEDQIVHLEVLVAKYGPALRIV